MEAEVNETRSASSSSEEDSSSIHESSRHPASLNANDPKVKSFNQSFDQEIEAQRIAPQLTSMVGTIDARLDSTLKSLGLVKDVDSESVISSEASPSLNKRPSSSSLYLGQDSGHLSVSSEVTTNTSLRTEINAVEEERQLANNSTIELQVDGRAISAPSRSLSQQPARMVQAAVDKDEEEGSYGENSDDGAGSWSSDVTDTSALRTQINAADEGHLSAYSTHLLLPPDVRAMLAQKGPFTPLTPSTPRRSLAVPPSPMMQAAVHEEEEGGGSSSSGSDTSRNIIMPATLPLESNQSVQSTIDEDEEGDGENIDDDAISFASSSSYSPTSKPASPPPLVSKLERYSIKRPQQNDRRPLIGAIICLMIIFAILFGSLPSNSPKSLPSASLQASATGGKSIRNWTPDDETPAVRNHVSNDTLCHAFEALVGDGVHATGSSQYLAAWWILEKDPRRHRSTLGRLEQRFLLACFYFKTSDNGQSPWSSCNYEQTSPLPRTSASRQTFIDHVDHSTSRKDVSRTTPTISERSSTSRSIQSSSCEFKQPLYDEQGEIIGYEMTESYRWLSGQPECSWAGIRCKYSDDNLAVNPVVEINLEGQIHYESIVTEILQLPSLESLYY